jgi:hypothetical protein
MLSLRFRIALIGLTVLTLIATSGTVSVSGNGYHPEINVEPGICKLSGDPTYTGSFTVTYPNGQPVSLGQQTVTLRVCGTAQGCITVQAELTPTGLGTYDYTFTVPSGLSGSVTVTLPTGSLTDSYGTSFPNTDTSLAGCAPVPEFNETALVAILALAAALFLLRRSRR